MRLVISGKHEISELEKLATELFSPIINIDVELPNLGAPAPYDEKKLSHVYKFVPIKDKDIISLYWFLPYT